MDIVGRKLTTCQVDAAGEWFRLGFEEENGASAGVILPVDCMRGLLMTLPGMIERALKARYRDGSAKLVYAMGDWSLESDAGGEHRILTLATTDGFKVAFALTPEKADHLAASLGDADADVPFSAPPH